MGPTAAAAPEPPRVVEPEALRGATPNSSQLMALVDDIPPVVVVGTDHCGYSDPFGEGFLYSSFGGVVDGTGNRAR